MRKLLSIVYTWYIDRRNRKFDRQSGVNRVDVPVISVGNITVGGSGKTPLVQMLVRKLIERGYRPAVVSRGYGRKSHGVVVVSDGKNLLSDVQSSGDELYMLAQSIPGITVIASELRYHGAARAIREFAADCIVLDDGFQHRQLYRDCDVVIVDASTLHQPGVLPAGLLREPLENLGRADVICLSSGASEQELRRYSDARCFEVYTRLVDCRALDLKTMMVLPRLALAVTAIAQPQRFVDLLKNNGVDCVQTRYFRDHHFYTRSDVASLIESCRVNQLHSIVTTEKDAVKLKEFEGDFRSDNIDVAVVRIETKVENETEFLNFIIDQFSERDTE